MKRLITIAATVLALVLAAASAASASTTGCRSGTEVIAGSTTNLSIILANTSVLPLKAYGVVHTKGTISLGGPTNGKSSLDFRAGKLTVNHTLTSGGTQPSLNLKTCVATRPSAASTPSSAAPGDSTELRATGSTKFTSPSSSRG